MRKMLVIVAVLLLALSIGAVSVSAYGDRHHQAAVDMAGSGTKPGDRVVQYDNRVDYNCKGQNCPYYDYDTDSCYYHDGSYDHNGYHNGNGYQNCVYGADEQDDSVNCYNSGGHHGGGHHGHCR